jgi:probable F420-dependent oxidoreductase
MPGYRFGIANPSVRSAGEYASEARRIEGHGFDFLAAADHLGHAGPLTTLAAGAAATERLRLRTYVLNVGFWVPALLAREAATVDLLSGGRLELGLGAGTVRAEFEEAGLEWAGAKERVARLEATVREVRQRLDDERHDPRPVQRPLPILVGAMSRGGLAVAADHADTVCFSALRHRRGHQPGTLRPATPAETDELVAFVKERTAGRPYEADVLVQAVSIDRDPLDAAAELAAGRPELEPEELLGSPCVLFARGAPEAAAEIERRRERWGFTSITTLAPSTDALAEVRRELES